MPSEPSGRPAAAAADQLHAFVGFVRSRLHEELAAPGLHHSTRRALQRRLALVGEIADQADGTAPASLMGRAANGVELVDLAQRWRDHPDYPGTRTTPEAAAPGRELPAAVTHIYERGITADLLSEVGGYPGLHEEARTELADNHPCRRAEPTAPVPVTVTSDGTGFLTVRAEIRCTDRACRIEAAAVARYEPLLAAYEVARESLRGADLLLQQPNLVTTPDPEQLRRQWARREKAIRETLRTVIDTLAPHAAPAAE
ncbi:hypothetical protein [Streptomyces sp. NRRL S-350]|uniref:hypothetical protein n=1 Tax=Streptomyces sp. NRRL S-350 TaxID=1463902 RepID=UPI0004C0C52D|nr:hypothetical protein [Streptomyces sp. NRRL S-350]